MDGRRDKPPDKNGSNKIPPETSELPLSEADIKSEPTIKEEREDAGGILMVPTSELANNRPNNAIAGDQNGDIIDFDGVEFKPEVKTEKIETKAEGASDGAQQGDVPKRSLLLLTFDFLTKALPLAPSVYTKSK